MALVLLLLVMATRLPAPVVATRSLRLRDQAFFGYTEHKGGTAPPPRPKIDFKVRLSSAYGQFTIKLLPDLAPDTCTLIWELAQKASCRKCRWERHEPVPLAWGSGGFHGPPYALMQGSMEDLARIPPSENRVNSTVRRGHACMVPGTKTVMIATADHPEWGQSHTIWGEVESIDDEAKHPFEPFHNKAGADGEPAQRWLNNPFEFELTALEPPKLRPPAESPLFLGIPYSGQATATRVGMRSRERL